MSPICCFGRADLNEGFGFHTFVPPGKIGFEIPLGFGEEFGGFVDIIGRGSGEIQAPLIDCGRQGRFLILGKRRDGPRDLGHVLGRERYGAALPAAAISIITATSTTHSS